MNNDLFCLSAAFTFYDLSAYYIDRVLSAILIDVAVCNRFDTRTAGTVKVSVLSCLDKDITFRTMYSPDDAITVSIIPKSPTACLYLLSTLVYTRISNEY